MSFQTLHTTWEWPVILFSLFLPLTEIKYRDAEMTSRVLERWIIELQEQILSRAVEQLISKLSHLNEWLGWGESVRVKQPSCTEANSPTHRVYHKQPQHEADKNLPSHHV